jgi:phosphotransferase system HPr-like phosphotransfer protein
MNETSSVTIRYSHRLMMKEIMELYTLTKKFNGMVTFYHNQHSVSGLHIAKLVTFFLTLKKGSKLLVVVDGQRNHLFLNKIKAIFENEHSFNPVSKSISFQHPLQLK